MNLVDMIDHEDAAPQRLDVVACDSFQRANNSTLGAADMLPYLPGRPGPTWNEVAGNWEINGNRIGSQGSSPGGQGWIVTLDLGVSDYVLEWQLAYTITANTDGIVVGYVDGTNYIRFAHTSSAIGGLRVTSGTPAAIGTGGSGIPAALGDVCQIKKVGAAYTYSLIRGGALLASHVVASETQGQSSTVIGLRAAAAASRWTNFCARRAA